MSTRANIILRDGREELWFYRHSDGYPSGTLPTLQKLIEWMKDNLIRDSVGQAAGWLILIGHKEYLTDDEGKPLSVSTCVPGKGINGWKVGAYEPTTGRHGDIEYLYTVDLREKTITYVHV